MRKVTRCALRLLAVTAATTSISGAQVSPYCFNATTVDGTPVDAAVCKPLDAKDLASRGDVKAALAFFRIDPGRIRFEGCYASGFSVLQASTAWHPNVTYVIRYPAIQPGEFLAPISHELAHVFQMDIAGGYERLQISSTPRKIELGADYLTGILFSQVFPSLDLGEFQHNLKLVGNYPAVADDHGTPSQRSAAFRYGVHMKFERFNRQIERAYEDFNANVYGRLQAYR